MTLPTIDIDSPLRGLADELRRQLQTKRDLVADTRRVSFAEVDADWLKGAGDGSELRPGLSLLIDLPDGAQAYNVTRHAHQQIGETLGIPWKLYERLLEGQDGNGRKTKRRPAQPDLLVHLANGLLAREPSKRLVRTMDGKARAFLSDRYRPRDNWDLLDQAVLPELAAFSGDVVFKRCDLTETRMYVKIVLPEFERPVTPKVGDVIRGGVIIQNSEVGNGSLGIYPYTDRLICTNGMVHTDYGKRSVHIGKRTGDRDEPEAWELYSDETLKLDDQAFFSKCRDTLRAILNETVFDAIVGQMRELAGIPVSGAPDQVVEVFARDHGLTDGERGSMLSALIDEGDRSGWGYVNALTRTARDLTDADRQTELETLAGRLVSDPAWALAAA